MWEVERSAAVSTARTVGPRQQRRNGSGVAGRPFIGADAPPPPSPPPPLSVAKVAAKLAATAGACPLQPRAHVEGSVCGSVGCGGGTDAWDPGGGGGRPSGVPPLALLRSREAWRAREGTSGV